MSAITTLKHRIGTCPRCTFPIWADVEIRSTLTEPTINADGRANSHSYAETIACRISHDCREEAES